MKFIDTVKLYTYSNSLIKNYYVKMTERNFKGPFTERVARVINNSTELDILFLFVVYLQK